jgi:hypothetical protein
MELFTVKIQLICLLKVTLESCISRTPPPLLVVGSPCVQDWSEASKGGGAKRPHPPIREIEQKSP